MRWETCALPTLWCGHAVDDSHRAQSGDFGLSIFWPTIDCLEVTGRNNDLSINLADVLPEICRTCQRL